MLRLCEIMDRISRATGQAAMHVYLIVALLSMYEVVARYLMNAPTVWSYEIVLALCALAWPLSGAYVSVQRRHIAITLIYDMISPRARWYLDLIAALFTIAALCVLVYLSFDLAVKALRFIDRSGSAFNSPLPTLLKCLLFSGAVLFVLQSVVDFARLIQRGPKEV